MSNFGPGSDKSSQGQGSGDGREDENIASPPSAIAGMSTSIQQQLPRGGYDEFIQNMPPPPLQPVRELFLSSQMGGVGSLGSNPTSTSATMPQHLQYQTSDASIRPGYNDDHPSYASSLSTPSRSHPAISNNPAPAAPHGSLLAAAPPLSYLNSGFHAQDILTMNSSTINNIGGQSFASLPGARNNIPSILSTSDAAASAQYQQGGSNNTLNPSTLHNLDYPSVAPMPESSNIPTSLWDGAAIASAQAQYQQSGNLDSTNSSTLQNLGYNSFPPLYGSINNNLSHLSTGSAAAANVEYQHTDTINTMGLSAIQNFQFNSFASLQGPDNNATAASFQVQHQNRQTGSDNATDLSTMHSVADKSAGILPTSTAAASDQQQHRQTGSDNAIDLSTMHGLTDQRAGILLTSTRAASAQQQHQQAGSDNEMDLSTMQSLADQRADILPISTAAASSQQQHQQTGSDNAMDLSTMHSLADQRANILSISTAAPSAQQQHRQTGSNNAMGLSTMHSLADQRAGILPISTVAESAQREHRQTGSDNAMDLSTMHGLANQRADILPISTAAASTQQQHRQAGSDNAMYPSTMHSLMDQRAGIIPISTEAASAQQEHQQTGSDNAMNLATMGVATMHSLADQRLSILPIGTAAASAQPRHQQAGSDNRMSFSTMHSLEDQRIDILPSTIGAASAAYPFQQAGMNANSLYVQADSTFLDPVHNFLRRQCIEVFAATKEDMTAPGRGARPTKIGQVGLRCRFCRDLPKKELAKQAVCFPSRRDTIFESVRNYQRTHFKACICISDQVKAQYKNLSEQGSIRRRSQKYLKAYYAESASEIGIVDTPNGLVFGAPPNESGTPSENLQALIHAAENPTMSSSFWAAYSPGQDKAADMRKFEHVASDDTRRVIINARKEPTPFVYPEDFQTVSDFEFVLFHQVCPSAPPAALIKQKGLGTGEVSKFFGFCCKHCDRAGGKVNNNRGMHFPANMNVIADTSFIQKMLNHFMNCPNVPQEVKNAFDELKRLASEHGTTAKRGSRKRFIEKIWERMKDYYGMDLD